MDREETRESRTILRRIEAHLRQSHLDMGASEDNVGFVDVLHHPQSRMPMLNYVTPRKNTAWVSGNHIEQGLDDLATKDRLKRVRFAEGLYPPVFVRNLRELGLEIEEETPVMVYKKGAKLRQLATPPSDVTFAIATSAEELAIWWYVWRNAYYDVAVSSVEPLLIGRDMQAVYLGRQVNIIMRRYDYPMGVIRLTLHENTAHLVAHAMLKEMRKPEWDKLLRRVALDMAIDNGADLMFAVGKTETERNLYRELGFVDSGNIVSYVEKHTTQASDEAEDDTLAQSVLVV